MNLKSARAAIEAILDAIPDSKLPKFDRVQQEPNGNVIAWYGGQGWNLGSAISGGLRDPKLYRRRAAYNAIQNEMVYRADQKFLANGDSLDGIKIAAKKVVG